MSNQGFTRNITDKFKAYRREQRVGDQREDDDRVTARLIESALDSSTNGAKPGDIELGVTGVFMAQEPDWVQASSRIKGDIADLAEQIERLRKQHGKALLVSFDADDTSAEAEVLSTDIKHRLRNLDREVKALSGMAYGDNQDVVKGVQRQLASTLYQLSVQFRKEETDFLNRLEQESGLKKGYFGQVVEDAATSAGQQYSDVSFTQAQLQRLDEASNLALEREEEIRKILETINELAQIMQDLSVLVVEQGTILDRIDHDVQEVSKAVDQGVQQLHKAERTQKNSMFLYCMLFLVVAILVMFVVIFFRKVLWR